MFQISINWSPSPDGGVKYFVYVGSSGLGPFTLLTSDGLSATGYTDSNPPAGQKVYVVRAGKLLDTGSGSFWNLSQGKFRTIP